MKLFEFQLVLFALIPFHGVFPPKVWGRRLFSKKYFHLGTNFGGQIYVGIVLHGGLMITLC